MATMTGGQAVAASLKAHGVKCVFGIPGIHNISIYDGLVDYPEIKHILVRHEQAAGFMADAYARTTGEVGVMVLTTGAGGANTITPLIEAYGSSSPVLAIVSQIDSMLVGKMKWALHEVEDQLKLFEPVTGWNKRIERIDDIPSSISQAMRLMKTGRPMPVQLEIPIDILEGQDEVEVPEAESFERPSGGEKEIEEAIEHLSRSQSPFIFAGGGVHSSAATAELLELSEVLGAPVVTTISGKGAILEDHTLSLGSWSSERRVSALLKESDLLIAVGVKFGNSSTRGWSLELPGNMIHIDIDRREIGKNYPVSLGIIGDAKLVLRQILNKLKGQDRSIWSSPMIDNLKKEIYNRMEERSPENMRILGSIRDTLNRDAIVTNDQTMICYLARQGFSVYEPRTFLSPMGSGTLGFAFPAALGAKVAFPERQVVALCGDGGFMFTCQELATAVKYGLNIPVIIFNDNCLTAIQKMQEERYGRPYQVELTNPDFVKFAESFGAAGRRVEALEELKPALRDALSAEVPTLIEVRIPLGN